MMFAAVANHVSGNGQPRRARCEVKLLFLLLLVCAKQLPSEKPEYVEVRIGLIYWHGPYRVVAAGHGDGEHTGEFFTPGVDGQFLAWRWHTKKEIENQLRTNPRNARDK